LCLYVAAVSPSGTRKSAALRDMLAPLYQRECVLQRQAEPEVRAAAERRKLAEARLEAIRKAKARVQDPDARERLCAEAETLARELPPVPAVPRLVVDDRTPEALALDLAEQEGSVLLASAEGADLFAVAAGRHVRDGGDQATIYLHAYDGERIDVRRITREAVRVEDPALSIVITPQPVVLERLREHPELHHRGLVPRFGLVVAPDLAGTRRYDPTATPNLRVRTAYVAALERLLALPRPRDAAAVPRLRLAGAALEVWRAYADRLERDLADGGRLALVREWASKHAGRVARIAGGLHLVATVGMARPWAEVIPAETVAAAVRLGEYLEAQALVAYDVMRADPRLRQARRHARCSSRTGGSAPSRSRGGRDRAAPRRRPTPSTPRSLRRWPRWRSDHACPHGRARRGRYPPRRRRGPAGGAGAPAPTGPGRPAPCPQGGADRAPHRLRASAISAQYAGRESGGGYCGICGRKQGI
ncbi:MAG: DUF3987 domain-containing protein, partial [Deltaproteobacteria bacterium]